MWHAATGSPYRVEEDGAARPSSKDLFKLDSSREGLLPGFDILHGDTVPILESIGAGLVNYAQWRNLLFYHK